MKFKKNILLLFLKHSYAYKSIKSFFLKKNLERNNKIFKKFHGSKYLVIKLPIKPLTITSNTFPRILFTFSFSII